MYSQNITPLLIRLHKAHFHIFGRDIKNIETNKITNQLSKNNVVTFLESICFKLYMTLNKIRILNQ